MSLLRSWYFLYTRDYKHFAPDGAHVQQTDGLALAHRRCAMSIAYGSVNVELRQERNVN